MLLVFKDGDAERTAGQWQLKASHNVDDIKLWLLRYGSGSPAASRKLLIRLWQEPLPLRTATRL